MSAKGKRSTSSKDSESSDAGSSRDAVTFSASKRPRTRFSRHLYEKEDSNSNSSSSSTQQVTDDPKQRSGRKHHTTASIAGSDAKHRSPSLGIAKLLFGSDIEKVHINSIRASNAKADQLRGLVAVFVGGTSGIGESTAKEFFRRTTKPKAYIIGRNETRGNEIIRELHTINPAGEAVFIKKDCSLIKNVDEVCSSIKQRESKINCLVLTAGYLTMKGRTETVEGLDRKMVVNYYSRMRYALNLMPLLTAAAEQDELSRVLTVLAAGSEGEVRLDDLDLRHHFSLYACMAHCVLMTDFMIEELSKRFPATSFSHSYPGTVKSGIANELTAPIRLAVKVLYAIMTPWIIHLQETGERHFFQMTSKCYPPNSRAAGIDVPDGLHVMRGSNGGIGTGAYLLDWDGKPIDDNPIIDKYRALAFGETVWKHTMAMFQQAEQRNPSSGNQSKDVSPGQDLVMDEANHDPVGWRAA